MKKIKLPSRISAIVQIIPENGLGQCFCCKEKLPAEMFLPKFFKSNVDRYSGFCYICRNAIRTANNHNGNIHNTVCKPIYAETRNAIKTGWLVLTGKCANCSEPAEVVHHPDYCYPLQVVEYCTKCHHEEHNRLFELYKTIGFPAHFKIHSAKRRANGEREELKLSKGLYKAQKNVYVHPNYLIHKGIGNKTL